MSTLPESPVEVAFVGRSNVGKSSLINALANRKQLAKVATRRLPETDPLVRGVGDHETEDQFAKSRLLR